RTSLETGGRAFIEVDHTEGDIATVHVYEILRDHSATLGWYDVDKKTGAVTRQKP
ncbi:hypothetical protein HY629_03090, partial [Candidatus Uhrbacteria bacterium]|nr:hypothetical protein [Candidatus Uhrbacteria bacterium]